MGRVPQSHFPKLIILRGLLSDILYILSMAFHELDDSRQFVTYLLTLIADIEMSQVTLWRKQF